MKKMFMLTLFAGLALQAFAQIPGDVVINEICYDTTDATEVEFIELYNNTGSSIDLSGWKFTDSEGLITIPAGHTIAANGFYVISNLVDSPTFNAKFGVNPNLASDVSGWTISGTVALANGGEQAAIFKADDTLIDMVVFDGGSTAADATPLPGIPAFTGVIAAGDGGNVDDSIARKPDGAQGSETGNDPATEDLSTVFQINMPPTPGATNGISLNLPPAIVEFAPFPTLPTSTSPIHVFANVTDPNADILTVTVDMTLQGGGTNNATLLDNGVAPDETASDNIYSGTVTAFGGADDGKTLTFVVHANDGTNPTVDSAALLVTIDDTLSPGTIAAARAAAIATTVIVNGISNNGKGVFNGNTFYLQDATGGINNFDTNIDVVPNSLIPLGADVTVLGRRSHAFGDSNTLSDIQLGEVGNGAGYDWLAIRVNSTGNALPAVQDLTTAELEANVVNYEGELVRVNDVTVSSGTWPTLGNSGSIEVNDGSGDTTCFIDVDAALTQRLDPAFASITGIASSQQVSGPTRDPRLLPRFDTDIETASAVETIFWGLYE